LSPCAIAASLLRRIFKGPLWFKLHRALNVLVVLFTAVAFGLAVWAINEETPEGASADHFNPDPNPHRSIGLVVFVVALIQAVLGVCRPHVPEMGEDKTTKRKVWEVAHKVLGYSCLGMALYQVQSGIKIYYNIFAEGQYFLAVFWAVIAGIGGGVAVGLISLNFISPYSKVDKDRPQEGKQYDIHSHGQPDLSKYAIRDQEAPSQVY
jgi:cytochrome b561